jgi:flagellar protein FlaJ
MELNTKQKIVTGSLTASMVLIAIGIAIGDPAVLGNLIIIAAFVFMFPFFFYKYSHFMWLKSLELQFPNFVRDLADAKRSGMSFAEAISMTKKTNYGKLTSEIEKMSNRLSWGTPVIRVLEIFGERVKESKIITEALHIIKESQKSGGRIAETLDSVANDIIMMKEAEAERSSMVKQHVAIMYGVFFIFLGVAIMIAMVMVPMIKSQPSFGGGGPLNLQFSNPCQNQAGFPCAIFVSVCSLFAIPEGIGCYYTSLFFLVIVIQGLFTGLIAGQLGENSVVAGLKHAMIMVFSALGIFLFLAKAGLLPY